MSGEVAFLRANPVPRPSLGQDRDCPRPSCVTGPISPPSYRKSLFPKDAAPICVLTTYGETRQYQLDYFKLEWLTHMQRNIHMVPHDQHRRKPNQLAPTYLSAPVVVVDVARLRTVLCTWQNNSVQRFHWHHTVRILGPFSVLIAQRVQVGTAS